MMEGLATMSNIRLIISDIDGTILTNHHVDEQLIESNARAWKRQNIPFV